MKRVLIVSPSFPPTSTADLHRVRTSLPFYAAHGWQPVVLAVRPDAHGGLVEPELESTLPPAVPIARTGAAPAWLMRRLGIGNPGIRALGHLYAAGARLIRSDAIDLVFFSTTMFAVATLGRFWKARFGTPYVIDLQDPWRSDYEGAGRRMNVKARLARVMHGRLEPFAMRRVDGVIAVSAAYTDALRRRYPWINEDMCVTIPFGASEADALAARALSWKNEFFDPSDGHVHAVAVGRGGRDMTTAASLLFRAVAKVAGPPASSSLRLSFIGTDYATGREQPTIAPIGDAAGIAPLVREFPRRVPYLHALRLLQEAHMTVILGSDDPSYSPSKVYPYLLAARPFVAVLHHDSPVVPLLRQAATGVVATFRPGQDEAETVKELAAGLERLLRALPAEAAAPAPVLDAISAREMTRQQCRVFDAAYRHAAAQGVPCPE